MNLRDFRYVLAVAETLNFKAAAERCHVSQPTLSMQIRKLEDRLGIPLFERTNKRVMLTASGRSILPVLHEAVGCEKQIHDIAYSLRNPESGEFRFGAFPTLASYVLPDYVPALLKAFPRLKLLLVEDRTNTLLLRLAEGTLDAALLALPVEAPGMRSVHIFDDPFLLAVGADHPLAHRKSVRLSDLDGRKLMLLEEGHCLRKQALDICGSYGAGEDGSFRATSLETLRLMIEAPHSEAMTLMPAVAVSHADKLRTLPFIGKKPMRRIGLFWRKSDVRSEMILKMADVMRRISRKDNGARHPAISARRTGRI
ncbi:MAG: LysR substrate-binding domain-containing protein [Alphaproteobacteria bacterium]|nr:LysR substrate-binding domain-containing protein [Alphaproteobacteria bacterium]